jgi:alpha-tubulin suppressor-like RCC1 family protein
MIKTARYTTSIARWLLISAVTLLCLATQTFAQCKVGVSSFASHAMILHPSGTVYSWGYNNSGQLGNGKEDTVTAPSHVLKGEYPGTTFLGDNPANPVIGIASLYRHSLALTADGIVYGWGANNYGELGMNLLGNRDTATKVLKGEYNGTTFLGDNPSNKIKVVSGGVNYSAVLAADGTVYSFGRNDYGQLGSGDKINKLLPVHVKKGAYNGTAYLGDNPANPVVAIAGGAEGHILALTADGSVFAWGRNSTGQLGTGDTVRSSTPIRVRKGAYNGALYLGDDPSNRVIAIAAGGNGLFPLIGNCSGALLQDGTVLTWGGNGWSLLGDGTSLDRLEPVRVLKGEYEGTAYLGDNPSNPVLQLSMGGYEVAALLADGSVYTWGNNLHGQLGNNSRAASTSPVRVLKGEYPGTTYLGDNPGAKVETLTATERNIYAVVNGFQIYGWGDNHRLQLIDTTIDRSTPVLVASLSTVTITDAAFGSVLTCFTQEREVSLTNNSPETVVVTQITVANPSGNFKYPTIASLLVPISLESGMTLTIPVSFAPSITGAFNSTITFTVKNQDGSNVIGEYTSNISGTGYSLQANAHIQRDYVASAGSTLTIPVVLEDKLDDALIDEVIFTLTFNGNVVDLTNAGSGEISSMLSGTILTGWNPAVLGVNDSSLTLKLTAPAGQYLNGKGTLLNLQFLTLEGTENETELTFIIEPADRSCAVIQPSPGHVTVGVAGVVSHYPSERRIMTLEPVHPHPVRSAFTLKFELAESQTVSVSIISSDGTVIATPISQREYGGGIHVQQLSTEALATGTYTIVVAAGNQTGMQRFVVVK